MWYAASLIVVSRYKDGAPGPQYVYENVVLLHVGPDESAVDKAMQIGEKYNTDNAAAINGRPVVWVFAGVRKIISCLDPEQPPREGTELTYSLYEVEEQSDIEALCRTDQNAAVKVIYLE